mgnify:CR=1 FL=1
MFINLYTTNKFIKKPIIKNNYPLMIIAEHEHWRQVVDFQGDIGWVYFRLLSGNRTIIVSKDDIFLRNEIKTKLSMNCNGGGNFKSKNQSVYQ